MRRRLLALSIVCILFGSGCAHYSDVQDVFNDLAQQTENLVRQNNPGRITKAAVSEDNQGQQYHLHTAISLIKSNKAKEAEFHLDGIDLEQLSAEDLYKVNLVYAQINLSYAKAEQALQHLELVQPQLMALDDKINYFQARAFALSLTNHFMDSAKARMELLALLPQKQQQLDNKAAIIDTLRLLPVQSLQAQQALNTSTTGGWLALASLFKATPYIAANNPNLTKWRNQYQNHPANSEFIKYYLAQQQKLLPSIAVLLPTSGSFAEAGKAIAEGLAAAYEQTPPTAVKPKLRYYDTSTSDPVTLYRKAVDEGAQFIIGPLNKEHVEQLAKNVNLTVPVLTLNHVPGLNKANLYQFALSPLDDVETITQTAIKDGHRRLVLLTPNSELGSRLQGFFKTAMQNQDAGLIKVATYDPEANNFNKSLQDLFNVNESEQRYNQLKRIIPNLHASTRSRKDIDAILLMAYPPNAKALQVQLKKITTDSPRIYATAHVYNGVANPEDTDLDGVKFCDIPWLFNAAYPGVLSQEALRTKWQAMPSPLLRLVAMGIDAYNLIPHLNQLNTTAYRGATGKLKLTADNRIQRELVCAQFDHQRPQLVGYTVVPQVIHAIPQQ